MGCKLALDMEMLHTLKWGNSEIDKVSQLEGNGSLPGIGIALLSRLSSLQTVANQLHLLLASLMMSGPNTWLSPVLDQLRGVRHLRPYRASKGAICRLAW
jgi:hypothetical protein